MIVRSLFERGLPVKSFLRTVQIEQYGPCQVEYFYDYGDRGGVKWPWPIHFHRAFHVSCGNSWQSASPSNAIQL